MVASLPKTSLALAALLSLSQSVAAQQYTTVTVDEVTVFCPYVLPTATDGETIPFCPGDSSTVVTGHRTVTDVLVTGIETLGYLGGPSSTFSTITSFATFYEDITDVTISSSYISSSSAVSSSEATTTTVSSATTSSATPSETSSSAASSTPTVTVEPSTITSVVIITGGPSGSNPSGVAEPSEVSVTSPGAVVSTAAAADAKVPHPALAAAAAGVVGMVAAVI